MSSSSATFVVPSQSDWEIYCGVCTMMVRTERFEISGPYAQGIRLYTAEFMITQPRQICMALQQHEWAMYYLPLPDLIDDVRQAKSVTVAELLDTNDARAEKCIFGTVVVRPEELRQLVIRSHDSASKVLTMHHFYANTLAVLHVVTSRHQRVMSTISNWVAVEAVPTPAPSSTGDGTQSSDCEDTPIPVSNSNIQKIMRNYEIAVSYLADFYTMFNGFFIATGSTPDA